MAKMNGIELKDATSNFERKILGLIEEQRKAIEYGRVNIELVITNGKVVLVELRSTQQTYKMD